MEPDAVRRRTIAHFRVLEPLGRGGMGVVYRAEDLKLRRHVALKVLPPERTADEEHRRRFLREARSAAAVSHPCIATVFEVGEDDDGTIYIAMELVHGRTLRALLADGAPPLHDALAIAHDIARGLASAHAAGVVHRDIKPDNVMIDDDRHVKILDFGLARIAVTAPDGMTEERITTGVRVAGTPEYMSPEQARAAPVGPASDVFSFGVLLYEMLCGRRPFSGESSIAIMASVLRDEPPPLEGVPAALAELVEGCLAKDPEARPADARLLQRELGAFVATSRVTVSSSSSLEPDRELELLPTIESESGAGPVATPAPRRASGGRTAAIAVLAGVLVVAVVALVASRTSVPARPRPPATEAAGGRPPPAPLVDPPLDVIVDDPPARVLRHIAVSEDGSTLALARDDAVYLRDLETDAERALRIPEGGHPAHVEWVGGDARALIAMSVEAEEGVWAWRVPADGAEPTRLFRAGVAIPSPTGGDLAYTTSGRTPCELRLRSEDGRDRLLHSGGCEGGMIAWSPDGASIALIAASDDPEVPGALRLFDRAGSSRVLLRTARLELSTTTAPLAFLPDGCVAVFLASPPPEDGCSLHRVCADHAPDEEPPLLARFSRGSAQALSFDRAGRAYVLMTYADAELHVAPLDEEGRPGAFGPVLEHPAEDRDAHFADDRTLVFHSNRSGRFGLYRGDLPTGEVRPLGGFDEHATYPIPTPDGVLHWRTRATAEGASSTTSLRRVSLDGGGDIEVLAPREAAFYSAAQPSPRTLRISCAAGECWLGEREGGVYRLTRLDGEGPTITVHGTTFDHSVHPGRETIAVARERDVLVVDTSGRGQHVAAAVTEGQIHGVAWHPSGRWLYATRVGGTPLFELLRVSVGDDAEVTTHAGSSHT